MNTISIAELEEIRATFSKLADVLKSQPAHVEGDTETATGAKLRDLLETRKGTEELEYLTGLAVYGTGVMVDTMLKDLQERVFELEGQILMILEWSLIQHEIIVHNLKSDKVAFPEKFSDQALFLLKCKGQAQ